MQIPSQQITFQTLELRFAQLLKIAERSRSSKFSNERIRIFHDSLLKVIFKMSSENFSTFKPDRLVWTYEVVEQLFDWFEYLVNSTINQTPYEIVHTLEEVLNDWEIPNESFILLTSLSSKRDDFAFQTDKNPAKLKGLKKYIHLTYGVEISQDLDVIRIILPKFLSHDYLTAVSLYHEIAHYIDIKSHITETILLDNSLKKTEENIIFHREHFADLFAAQYVDLASCSHVCYLTYQKDPGKYPPTPSRVAVVEEFLKGGSNELIRTIAKATKKCTKKDLKIRSKKVGRKDFDNLIPIDIKSLPELHGVFITAWDIWLDPKSRLRKKFTNKNDLYRVLNNLVEKSISNFFLMRSWKSKNVSRKKIN